MYLTTQAILPAEAGLRVLRDSGSVPSMKIATWNVNGIRAREAQVLEWVAAERPEVLCLQEIKASPEKVPAALCSLEEYWCYWHGAGGYSGVGLHVSRTLAPEQPAFFHPDFDHEARVVAARTPLGTVASVYVPNGGKDFGAKLRFFEALIAFAADHRASGTPLFLCGDMNVAHAEIDVHPKERKSDCIGQLPEERALFTRLLSEGLVDVARVLHPEDDGFYTWWAPWRNMRQRNIGWRIDYILASSGVAARAVSCSSQREVGTSDHAPLVAKFDVP